MCVCVAGPRMEVKGWEFLDLLQLVFCTHLFLSVSYLTFSVLTLSFSHPFPSSLLSPYHLPSFSLSSPLPTRRYAYNLSLGHKLPLRSATVVPLPGICFIGKLLVQWFSHDPPGLVSRRSWESLGLAEGKNRSLGKVRKLERSQS